MTIIRWVEEGRIHAYKTPGGHRRIMRADLEDFCTRNNIPMQWQERVSQGVQKVLVISDNPLELNAILDALIDQGPESGQAFEVRHTGNAFEAGRFLHSFKPMIIFLDLDLANLDAKGVIGSIREDEESAEVRLIGITHPGRHQELALDDFLIRPFAKNAVRQATGPVNSLAKRPTS